MTYPIRTDPLPHPEPRTLLRLYVCRVGKWGSTCDGCDGKITAHKLAVIRNDGLLYCSEGCARTHPHPTCPTSAEKPV